MFPCEVQLMEGENNIIPSFVWLERFDSRSIDGRKPMYFFDSAILGVNEIRERTTNRKVDVFWRSMSVSLSQHDHQQVECATHGMNDHTHLDVDQTADWLDSIKLYDLLPYLRVSFFDETVRGAVSPGFKFIEQIPCELGFGPIQTCLNR